MLRSSQNPPSSPRTDNSPVSALYTYDAIPWKKFSDFYLYIILFLLRICKNLRTPQISISLPHSKNILTYTYNPIDIHTTLTDAYALLIVNPTPSPSMGNPPVVALPSHTPDPTMFALHTFRFSSKILDTETGLTYYNYRYYSPELGRWLSRDPINELGHVLLKKANTQPLYSDEDNNPYRHTSNNPLNKTDKNGEVAPVILVSGIVLAAATCAFGFYKYAQSEYGSETDDWLHCYVSCKIATYCGHSVSILAGLGKEARDALVKVLIEKGVLDESWQGGDWEDIMLDLLADAKGNACAELIFTSCKCCCDRATK